MTPINRSIRLVPKTDRDQSLVESWLERKHVRKWWGEPQKALAELAEWTGDSAIIELDCRKVGFVCWCHPTRRELDEAGLHEIPTTVIDIDIMIGEEYALGIGVGSSILPVVVKKIFKEYPAAPAIMAGASANNSRSIRAGINAGFRIERHFDDPDWGESVLLWKERD